MDKKIILGFVGEMASGKGTIAEYLKEKYNASSHRFSTMLRDVADRLYIEKNRENLQRLSTVLRENFSQDLMSKVLAKDVDNDKNNVIVVDGVRRFSDITYLKKINNFKLVYVTADIKKRYERLLKRTENTDDQLKSFEEFKNDHKQEAEIEIVEVGTKADFKINNDGSFKELYDQIEEILKKA